MRHISILVLAASCLLLGGCFEFRTYVESYKPTIPVPEQQDLAPLPSDSDLFNEDGSVRDPEALKQAYYDATGNLVIVINESEDLRAVVQAYNEWAERQNVETGYTLPDPIQPAN